MDGLKLRKVGDAVVVTIPDDVLERLNLKEGDSLSLDVGADGITLKPDASAGELASADRMMHRYEGVLKRLAR